MYRLCRVVFVCSFSEFLNVVLASDTVCEKLTSDYSNEKPHLCTSSSAVRVSIVSTWEIIFWVFLSVNGNGHSTSVFSINNLTIFVEIFTARTQELMHQGALRLQKSQANQNHNVQTEQAFKCQSCMQSKCGVRVMCIFCERHSCTDCSRQCAHCAGIFCSLCSIAK